MPGIGGVRINQRNMVIMPYGLFKCPASVFYQRRLYRFLRSFAQKRLEKRREPLRESLLLLLLSCKSGYFVPWLKHGTTLSYEQRRPRYKISSRRSFGFEHFFVLSSSSPDVVFIVTVCFHSVLHRHHHRQLRIDVLRLYRTRKRWFG